MKAEPSEIKIESPTAIRPILISRYCGLKSPLVAEGPLSAKENNSKFSESRRDADFEFVAGAHGTVRAVKPAFPVPTHRLGAIIWKVEWTANECVGTALLALTGVDDV